VSPRRKREQAGQQVRRSSSELEALDRVRLVVSSSLPLNEILDRALDQILTIMEMEAAEVCLLDASENVVSVFLHRGQARESFLERTRFTVGEGIPGLVVQTGEMIFIPDVSRDHRFLRAAVVRAGFKSFIGIPLKIRGEVLGCLNAAARRVNSFTAKDVRFLTLIAVMVAMTMSNAHLYEHLDFATKQLEAKVEELWQIQDQLVGAERQRVVDQRLADVSHDLNIVLKALKRFGSLN